MGTRSFSDHPATEQQRNVIYVHDGWTNHVGECAGYSLSCETKILQELTCYQYYLSAPDAGASIFHQDWGPEMWERRAEARGHEGPRSGGVLGDETARPIATIYM